MSGGGRGTVARETLPRDARQRLEDPQIWARRGGGLSARFLNTVFTPRHCPRDTVSPLWAGVLKTGSELHFR